MREVLSVISAVNYFEVVAKPVDYGMAPTAARGAVAVLALQVEQFGLVDAEMAGVLRSTTRPSGLSLGDRACLALAMRLGLPALTTDRAWSRVTLAGAQIESIR